MNTIIAMAIGAIGGIIICFYNLYIFGKIKMLELKINSLPNPEEMAKQILKVKLPLSELTPEMIQNGLNLGNMSPEEPVTGKKSKKDNYIG
jgi:hypothetical protein